MKNLSTNEKLDFFLNKLKEQGIVPNFWCSKPYLLFSKVGVHSDGNYLWIEETGQCLFPPISISSNPILSSPQMPSIWADFQNSEKSLSSMGFKRGERLDWEYIYEPIHFMNMEGKKWAVFRKNARKWARGIYDWTYTEKLKDVGEVKQLGLNWLQNKGESMQDAEVFIQYILGEPFHFSKRYLYDGQGNLMGLNIWDENYHYINYRFCVCRDDQPFLDEFMRLLFYLTIVQKGENRKVNDGGTLDSLGLERFKDKMNPIQKREVFSWEK